ncbi:MAG: DUF4159 domain-containing protein [Verrucomicrobia bacterium]|nr:DUF4159 domain-containing protein [Verrucomicrobiota bacterium]
MPSDRGRRSRRGSLAVMLTLLVLAAVTAYAQRRWGRGWLSDDVRTAREVPQHGAETPVWTNTPGFDGDTFTFARIRYDGGGWRRGAGWTTDLPDADLNLSYRLHQMTSLKVDPNGRILRLTDPELVNYPLIYIVEPGGLYLSGEEVLALRRYLLNGGFLWLDDFWGEEEWDNMAEELAKVFPDRSFEELPLDHPLYRCVMDIKGKHQVPNVQTGTESQFTGVTWEPRSSSTRTVHHRVIFDDKGRIMVFASHNTDNGDGWEWEGLNFYYFREFSEKTAYPLAINVLYYIMTH